MSKKYIITCLELIYTCYDGDVMDCNSYVTLKICNSFEEAIDEAYKIACTKRENAINDSAMNPYADDYESDEELDISIPKSDTGTYTNILDDLYNQPRSYYNDGKSFSITTKLLDDVNNHVGIMVKTGICDAGVSR